MSLVQQDNKESSDNITGEGHISTDASTQADLSPDRPLCQTNRMSGPGLVIREQDMYNSEDYKKPPRDKLPNGISIHSPTFLLMFVP